MWQQGFQLHAFLAEPKVVGKKNPVWLYLKIKKPAKFGFQFGDIKLVEAKAQIEYEESHFLGSFEKRTFVAELNSVSAVQFKKY